MADHKFGYRIIIMFTLIVTKYTIKLKTYFGLQKCTIYKIHTHLLFILNITYLMLYYFKNEKKKNN